MTKEILLTLTYLVGAGELILAIYFWVTHSKSEIRKVMGLFALSMSLWVIFSGLVSYTEQNTITTVLLSLVFVFAICSLALLLHFVLIYPYPVYRFDRIHRFLFYVPVIIFSVTSFIPKVVFLSFSGDSQNVGTIQPGPIYSTYNIYLVLLFITAIVILLKRGKKFDGQHKRNSKILLWSIILGGLPALIIDLIMPIIMPKHFVNTLYANIATGFWLGATTYIISRK